MNPKSRLVKSNSEQYQFLFKYISSKNQSQNFKIKKKRYFGVIFPQREFFLKTLAKHNCSGPLAFKCQRFRESVKLKMIPSLSAYKNQSVNLLNSSNDLWDTPDLRVPWSIRPRQFLTIIQKIIKVTFGFLEFLLTHQKSVYFINSFLRYGQF